MSSPSPASPLKGIACIVIAMAVFVINDTLLKHAVAMLPPLQVIFLRGLFALACVGTLVSLTCGWSAWRLLFGKEVMARSSAEFVCIMGFVIALARLPISDVTAVAQTSPLFIVPLAAFFYREKLGLLRVVLILLGFGGALLITQPGGSGFDPWIGFAFLSALAITARDMLSRAIPPALPSPLVGFSTIAVVATYAGIGTLATGWTPPSGTTLIMLAGAGLCVAIAHSLMIMAYRLAPASTVSPFSFSATLWAWVSGVLVFQEVPETLKLLGLALLIVAGAALAWMDRDRGG